MDEKKQPQEEVVTIYERIESFLKELTFLFFWIGKFLIVQATIMSLVVLGLFVWFQGTKNLVLLFKTRSLSEGFVEFSAVGIMETYLSAIVLLVLAVGLHGIFVAKRGERPSGILRINSMAELDSYLFGAITSVLLVTALKEVLSPSAPFKWHIVLAVAAIVVVISFYLFATTRPKPEHDTTEEIDYGN